MLPLADLQQRIRDAVVGDDLRTAAPLLIGGGDPARRLAIHRRHYETSLAGALMGRFPATGWLIGTDTLESAVRLFVRVQPPTAPCVAEYGRDFPKFLAELPGFESVPCLQTFADLDWHLGRLAVAVDRPAITRDSISAFPPEQLADASLTIQTGTHYVNAPRAIDDLMKLYLAEETPNRIELPETDVWLEVRGSRGAFRFARLAPATFTFRASLASGLSIGDAAERTWTADASFDPGAALAQLADSGLIIAIAGDAQSERSGNPPAWHNRPGTPVHARSDGPGARRSLRDWLAS